MDKLAENFAEAQNLYDAINCSISNFKHKMAEMIGFGELPLFDPFGAYEDAVQAEMVNRHGETCEVAIDKVRYDSNNYTFYFHVVYINNEKADEWVYDGAFTDSVCDLLATALPTDEED